MGCSLRYFFSPYSYFRNAINHPALLDPARRCHYRNIAHYRVRDSHLQNQLETNLVQKLSNTQMSCKWRENIQVQVYKDLLCYSGQHQSLPKWRYGGNPLEFLRFSRNCKEHIRGNVCFIYVHVFCFFFFFSLLLGC